MTLRQLIEALQKLENENPDNSNLLVKLWTYDLGLCNVNSVCKSSGKYVIISYN